VNNCVLMRAPMAPMDLWNWCAPTADVPEGRMQVKSWGQIKDMYR